MTTRRCAGPAADGEGEPQQLRSRFMGRGYNDTDELIDEGCLVVLLRLVPADRRAALLERALSRLEEHT